VTWPLLKRIVVEKRLWIVPLAAGLILDAGLYAFMVYPLSARVADAEGREAAAAQALKAAQQEYAAATGTLTGKTRTSSDLEHFYAKVLPVGLAGARRATYLRLADLAREAGLTYERRLEESKAPKQRQETTEKGRLAKFEISMVLKGGYEGVRRFLHSIETTPEFIVIDNISLTQGVEPGSALVLALDLSTYYRAEVHVP
jgi:Tfp pilus assembly protein PilO